MEMVEQELFHQLQERPFNMQVEVVVEILVL